MNVSDFRGDFSSSAFRTIDGTRRIVGRFCEVEVVGDSFDLWLVKPDRSPIGTLKLKHLISAIEALPEFSCAGRPFIRKLGGEAYLSTGSVALVREAAFYGGVKRRKRYSEAALLAATARLRGLRGGHV